MAKTLYQCEKSHNKAISIVENFFEDKARFKYPTKIICEMEDGEQVGYYRIQPLKTHNLYNLYQKRIQIDSRGKIRAYRGQYERGQ